MLLLLKEHCTQILCFNFCNWYWCDYMYNKFFCLQFTKESYEENKANKIVRTYMYNISID